MKVRCYVFNLVFHWGSVALNKTKVDCLINENLPRTCVKCPKDMRQIMMMKMSNLIKNCYFFPKKISIVCDESVSYFRTLMDTITVDQFDMTIVTNDRIYFRFDLKAQ